MRFVKDLEIVIMVIAATGFLHARAGFSTSPVFLMGGCIRRFSGR